MSCCIAEKSHVELEDASTAVAIPYNHLGTIISLSQQLVVCRSQTLFHAGINQILKRRADDLFPRNAEKAFPRRVDACNQAVKSPRIDDVVQMVECLQIDFDVSAFGRNRYTLSSTRTGFRAPVIEIDI